MAFVYMVLFFKEKLYSKKKSMEKLFKKLDQSTYVFKN